MPTNHPYHSCYSAYEHYSLTTASASNPHLSTQPPPTANNNLPVDISLETLTSVILICVGLVLGSEELKPISWRVWAGKVEREHGAGGPFGGLEERWGFMDVRVGFFYDIFVGTAEMEPSCGMWANV